MLVRGILLHYRDKEWKDTKKRTLKKRGRGRPRKRVPTSDGER